METFTVYILYSKSSGKLYYGQTNNLKDRLDRHAKGEVPATKYGRPWELLFHSSHSSRSESMREEKKWKNVHGQQKALLRIQKFTENGIGNANNVLLKTLVEQSNK